MLGEGAGRSYGGPANIPFFPWREKVAEGQMRRRPAVWLCVYFHFFIIDTKKN
jgi:hypothetical protein